MNKSEKKWLKQQLNQFDAVITGSHLVLTSGKHSGDYINLRVLAGHTKVLREISEFIAEAIIEHEIELVKTLSNSDMFRPIVIIGPETLGRTLAEFTAILGSFDYFAWCNMKKDIDFFDVADWNPKLDFSKIINGARCYIIDDLLTTSKTLQLIIKLIEETGGKVEGVIVVVRRSQEVTAEVVGVPWLYPLLDVTGFNSYEEHSCPLCEDKVPMRLRPGHGCEWIKLHPDYPIER